MQNPLFEYNLTPCRFDHWAHLDPMLDLAENVGMATEIIKKLDPFFRFTRFFRGSGFAKRTDSKRALFHVQFWTKSAEIWRSFIFPDIGFTGILHVEVRNDDEDVPDDVDHTIFEDHLQKIIEAIDESQPMPDGWAETTIATVQGHQIQFSVPWRAD